MAVGIPQEIRKERMTATVVTDDLVSSIVSLSLGTSVLGDPQEWESSSKIVVDQEVTTANKY